MEHERNDAQRSAQKRPRRSSNREAERRTSGERMRQNSRAPKERRAQTPNRTAQEPRTERKRQTQEKRTASAPRPAQEKRSAQRDSRAAQEAQRRREERKERARLDGLREKQKRKAKHRTHKRISADVWKRLLIMAGVVAALVLSMVIFFRVRNLEATGNSYYTAEEILSAAGVAQGDNLLTVQRGQIAGSVMAELPYVRSVQVSRQLPDTLVIHVTEFDATYGIQDEADDWYLMTAGGKITEKTTAQEAQICIKDLRIQTPTIGEAAVAYADSGKEENAAARLEAVKTLLQELEDAELTKEITLIEVPSAFSLCITYADRFVVELGNTERLDYKLEFLKAVISEQKSYAAGTIDLTLKSGDEAHVRLNGS